LKQGEEAERRSRLVFSLKKKRTTGFFQFHAGSHAFMEDVNPLAGPVRF
jgi:hypothetical protein